MTTKTLFAALALTVAGPSLAQALPPCHLAPRTSACTIDSAADQRHIARPSPDRFRLPRQPLSYYWQDYYQGEHGSMGDKDKSRSSSTTVIQSETRIQSETMVQSPKP